MHEIVTIVKNGMPAPYQLDVTVRTTVHGNADEYFDHLEAVMSACGFHKDTFEDTISEIASAMYEDHDRETFSLLARAQETLSKSPLKSDTALAAEILEMLVGKGEELEDEDLVNLGGGASFDLSDVDPVGPQDLVRNLSNESMRRQSMVNLGAQPEDAFPFAMPDEPFGAAAQAQMPRPVDNTGDYVPPEGRFNCGDPNCFVCGYRGWPFPKNQLVPVIDGEEMILVVGKGMALLIDASENLGGLFAED